MRKMTPCLEVAVFPLTRACWLSSSNSHGGEAERWVQSCNAVPAIAGSPGRQLPFFGILLVTENHSPSRFQSSASCLSNSLKAAIPAQTFPWVLS